MPGPRTVSSYELGQIADGAATDLAAEAAARIAGDAASVATAAADATTKANAAQAAAIAASIPRAAFTAADKLLYSTAPSTYAETGITSSWRGILADSTSASWDATNKVITIGPNTSPTGLILRTYDVNLGQAGPVPDPVNAAANFILSAHKYAFMKFVTNTSGAGGYQGFMIGLNDQTVLAYMRQNYPYEFWNGGNGTQGGPPTKKLTIGQDGQPVTAHVGMKVADLTAGSPVYATTGGRLTTTPQAAVPVYANITTKAAADSPYTVAAADATILCNAVAGVMTINLPAAASSTGRVLRFKKIDSSANAVTLDGNASETIDGATTYAIAAQWAAVDLQCDGSNWYIVG